MMDRSTWSQKSEGSPGFILTVRLLLSLLETYGQELDHREFAVAFLMRNRVATVPAGGRAGEARARSIGGALKAGTCANTTVADVKGASATRVSLSQLRCMGTLYWEDATIRVRTCSRCGYGCVCRSGGLAGMGLSTAGWCRAVMK